MRFTIHTADTIGKARNTKYPNRVEIDTEAKAGHHSDVSTDATATLKAALAFDHVCAEYTDNKRTKNRFLHSNCIVMDMDNDHSEDSADWITAQTMEHIFRDVNYVLATSRNHMKEKGDKSPRPRFHVYFPITDCGDMAAYEALKQELANRFTFFDSNATDAARFLFGCVTDITWHEGTRNVDEWLKTDSTASQAILSGSRNSTMYGIAVHLLKRHGDTEAAYATYRKELQRCMPPLPEGETVQIWNSARKFFHNTVEADPAYLPAEVYEQTRQGRDRRMSDTATEAFVAQMKPGDWRDLDQARVFMREYGNQLKYTEATEFLRYDGVCWQEDAAFVFGALEEFSDLQKQDAAMEMSYVTDQMLRYHLTPDKIEKKDISRSDLTREPIRTLVAGYEEAKKYNHFASKQRDYKNMVAVMNAGRHMVNCNIDSLDANPLLLNTPKATYSMSRGLRGKQEHNPADAITKVTACDPGRKGERIWKEALHTFFCHDEELIEYVQEIVGQAAIGKVFTEALVIAYGEGRNGKSTFWNVIARVLGSYAGNLSADTLTTGVRRNVKPELAELKGKRLVIASELEEGTRLSTSILKQLCSTDMIYAEKKYKAPFGFTPTHTLVLCTNHLPKVGANDEGTWRRIIVIPFNATIPEQRDIKNYGDYLFQNAGPAILKWILEGAVKTINHGYKLATPKAVEEVMNGYRANNDWLGDFLEQFCDMGIGLEMQSGELYKFYRQYCIQTGEYIRSTSAFYESLKKSGFSRRKTNKCTMIQGLKLRDDILA